MFIEPVFGKKFFGREQILATLQKRVTAIKGGYRQNLALTGPMLAGKSSILRHFLKNVTDPNIIPIYIEMVEEGFKLFCYRFMATLLYQYLKSEGCDSEGDFLELKEKCAEYIPVTVKQIDRICLDVEKKKENEAYERLLELSSTFKYESGKNCIVILDEFHNLSNFHLKKPFQVFGKFIMVQKNTMYIVSSSQKTLLKEILSRKLSLLFGNFEVIEVDGFDNQTARSFIAETADDLPVAEEIKSYIIQITQGNPFYIEMILKKYSETLNKKSHLGGQKECLLSSLADLLYDSGGILYQYFTNHINFFLEKKTRRRFLPILVSLAKGHRKIKDIQKNIGKVDKDLGSKLEKLRQMDLIYKSGVFYRIQDKFFEFWLKNVHSIKMDSVIDDMDIKYLEFKNAVESDFNEYSEFISKDVTDIVCALFSAFNKEKVNINMNERKLPGFDRVECRNLPGNIVEIEGHLSNNVWLCHIKTDDIMEEQDISHLMDLKTGYDEKKIIRKIVIPLKGVERNAFLMAKEHGIWVWDISQLNKILLLFGKYELVL